MRLIAIPFARSRKEISSEDLSLELDPMTLIYFNKAEAKL